MVREMGSRDRPDLSQDGIQPPRSVAAGEFDRDPAPTITYAPIRYTPTFVLIEDGKEIGRIEGYPGDEFFWVRLENLLERLPPPQAPKGVSAPAFGVGSRGAHAVRARATRPSKSSTAKPGIRSAAGLDIDMMQSNAHLASKFLKALSHEGRLLILCFLSESEKSVTEIEKMLNLRQPAVSQQLARLRIDNLIEARRDGKSIYYSLARPEVREIVAALHAAFCRPKRSK